MSLILKSDVTINALGTELYIEFLEATGDYVAVDNIGGFGAPNPARNTLAIVLFAEHKNVLADTPANILAYNATSVASFTVTLSRAVNGVMNFVLFAIPIFDSVDGVYVDGNVVYDNENPSEPFIKEMVAGVFVVRTPEELIGNATVVQRNDYTFAMPDAISLANLLNANKMKKLRQFVYDECDRIDYEPLRDSFEYVDNLIKSATNSFCTQAYNEAQIDIEEVFKYGLEIAVLDDE